MDLHHLLFHSLRWWWQPQTHPATSVDLNVAASNLFYLCGRRCFRRKPCQSMSLSKHLPQIPATQEAALEDITHKNKFAVFVLVCEIHQVKRGCDERMCTHLILVEIGLFHFSQGVFQVAKHEFLNLVVVCGPYFLESHTNTDVFPCAMK